MADKLKDGDVVDQKLFSWIVNEIQNINLKLDAGAKSDLGASLFTLKEGFILLNTVLVKDQSGEDRTETSDEGSEAEGGLQSDSHTLAAYLSCITSFLTGKMKNLQISNLVDAKKEALFEAKKRFREARVHATKAFSNKALTLVDRVLAMNVRLIATILEKVENPLIVLPVCRSCLEELHLMPEVEKNFLVEVTGGVKAKISKEERRQIISTVCQINRLVYDVTKMVGDGKGLLLWPYIKVNDEKIDPLRDSRVARSLRKQNMDHCCLTRSFGLQEDEEQRSLKSATGIATNSLGHIFMIDKVDGSIKVFDTTGRFLSAFSVPPSFPPVENIFGNSELKSIDTDRNDNIYVLQVTTIPGEKRSNFINEIFVFKKPESDSSQSIFASGKSVEKAEIFRVMHDQKLLLLVQEIDLYNSPSEVWMQLEYLVYKCEVFNESGAYRAKKGKSLIGGRNRVDMIITSDNDAVILDSGVVYMIKDCKSKSRLKKKEMFEVDNARAIAYYHISEKIIIVSNSVKPEIPSLVSIYNKDGTFDRSIHFEVGENYGIKGVSVTRDGVICISANSVDPPKGKVIVL